MLISVGFFVWVKCIFVNMKRILLFLSIVSFFASCKKSEQIPAVTTVQESVTDSLPNVIQDNQKDTLVNQNHSGDLVLNEVVTFVGKMQQQGWISDTVRLKKLHQYKYLNTDSIHYINNYPFYKIMLDDASINDGINDEGYAFMQKAKSIIDYFYYNKEKGNFISDGIIEQWEFKDNEQAKQALDIIRDNGNNIYFNTNHFACRIKNYVIIFHTRAMSFSYDQKNIFRQFTKDNKIKEADLYNGPYRI